jgi:hypothetical protein
MSAKVMVPLASSGVRAYSNQIPVFDLQEGNLIVHNPSYSAVYREKAAAFGWEGKPLYGLLGHNWRARRADLSLTPGKAIRLGKRFGADLAVRATSYPEWPFPELYRNSDYVIYRLPADLENGG